MVKIECLPVMTSNNTSTEAYYVENEPIEVKEEKIEIVDSWNESCISTEENTNEVDGFTSTLNHNEIISTIKVNKELDIPLMDASTSEFEERYSENYIEIKEDKVFDCVLTSPEEDWKVSILNLQDFDNVQEIAVAIQNQRFNKKWNETTQYLLHRTALAATKSVTKGGSGKFTSDNGGGIYNYGKNEYSHQTCFDILPSISPEPQRKCKMCGFNSSEESQLRENLENCFGEKKPFQSKICTCKCIEINSLKNNIKIDKLEKSFQFKIHDIQCAKDSNSKNHIRIHTDEFPQCEICGFKSTVSKSLKRHMKVHTGEKPFRCEICSLKFAERSNLKGHMKIHVGDKPFRCETCGFKCIARSNLKRHMLIHTGDKPFRCEICEYQCTVSSRLKNHMRLHTGEFFQCEICSFKFAEHGNLKRHMKVHTGDKPFRCDICSYKCTQRTYLKTHMRIHTGDKPFQCDRCGYRFTGRSGLKSHMRIHKESDISNVTIAENNTLKA